jgi:hypothetical protein
MVGLLVYCLGTSPLFAAEELIDPEHSSLILHVGKSGFLSAAGELWSDGECVGDRQGNQRQAYMDDAQEFRMIHL